MSTEENGETRQADAPQGDISAEDVTRLARTARGQHFMVCISVTMSTVMVAKTIRSLAASTSIMNGATETMRAAAEGIRGARQSTSKTGVGAFVRRHLTAVGLAKPEDEDVRDGDGAADGPVAVADATDASAESPEQKLEDVKQGSSELLFRLIAQAGAELGEEKTMEIVNAAAKLTGFYWEPGCA